MNGRAILATLGSTEDRRLLVPCSTRKKQLSRLINMPSSLLSFRIAHLGNERRNPAASAFFFLQTPIASNKVLHLDLGLDRCRDGLRVFYFHGLVLCSNHESCRSFALPSFGDFGKFLYFFVRRIRWRRVGRHNRFILIFLGIKFGGCAEINLNKLKS